MKKLIKSLIPPIMLDKFYLLSNYKYFLKYKDLISKNIELKDKHSYMYANNLKVETLLPGIP